MEPVSNTLPRGCRLRELGGPSSSTDSHRSVPQENSLQTAERMQTACLLLWKIQRVLGSSVLKLSWELLGFNCMFLSDSPESSSERNKEKWGIIYRFSLLRHFCSYSVSPVGFRAVPPSRDLSDSILEANQGLKQITLI